MHKIAFIGAGDVVRRSYLPAISKRADCKIMAICSRHGKSARELAALYGIGSLYTDYDELLESAEVETVFIVTPPYLHREMAERAIEKGKNVLVEKPLCATYQDARLLLARADRCPRTFYAAFNNQFREENQWLRARTLSGDLGDVELIDFEWYRTKRYESKSWLYDRCLSGGGALMDFGVHLIHFALSLVPQRRSFTAYWNRLGRQDNDSVEDMAVGFININDTIGVLVKTGWNMKLQVPARVTLAVYGSQGCSSNLDYAGDTSDGFTHLIGDFLSHIESGTSPDLSLVEDTMCLLDALYLSGGSRSIVKREFQRPQ